MSRAWIGATLAAAIWVLGVADARAQGFGVRGNAGARTGSQTDVSRQSFLMIPEPSVRPVFWGGESNKAAGSAGDCDEQACDVGGAPGWCHCTYAYGGFMYLRARDSEVAFAVTAKGPITPGSSVEQVSPVAVLDPDYQPGFFVGFGVTLDECSAIGVHYMQLDATTNSSLETSPPDPYVVRSLVAHPSTFNAAADGLFASGNYDIGFKVLDIEYRQLLNEDDCSQLNYLVGLRLAQLHQMMNSQFAFNGLQNVDTDVDFYGAGLKLGLEYERLTKRGFLVYAKGNVSLVPGEFTTSYRQYDDTDPNVVNTGWKAGRVVTMLDLEVGAGWVSCCGRYRLTAGYLFQSWSNVVQTDEWIRGVQTNDFVDMSSAMTFDGLMARVEARF